MEKQKRIVFIVTSLGQGGAQKVMGTIANECVRNNYSVHVISIMNSPINVNLRNEIKTDNLGIKSVGGKNNLAIFLKHQDLYRKLRSISPNVVVLFGTLSAIFCYRAVRRVTDHVIACERDNPLGMKKMMFLFAKKIYSKVDVAVFQMPQVAKIYGMNKDKYRIIPNACLAVDNSNITFDYEQCSKSKLFLSAGRLEKVKRFDVLIEAFSMVHKEYGEYKLNIYGDGSEKENLQSRINKLGLQDVVFLKGQVDNVWKETEPPYAFVLSSDSEGVPNVLMEAMIYGVPCVSTDCEPGGARFLLDDGDCGLLSKINDSDDLCNHIVNLIADPELHRRLSGKGKKRVMTFDKSAVMKMWLRAFEEVLEVKECY